MKIRKIAFSVKLARDLESNRPEARYGLPPPQGEFCRP